ncbi:MAG: hypothetical protein C5B43_02445 [Verrucomicrobia bacterium]|nr:MAG: hypothetical protein C5B43_02445 [Verrucomicrobiota bacterium]
MDEEEIRIIYEYKSIKECADVWLELCNILKREGLLSERYEIDERGFKITKIEKLLEEETSFNINDQFFEFTFGSVWSAEIQQLIITRQKKFEVNWDIWIENLSQYGIFVNAWKFNGEYTYWQNRRQIDSYKRENRPYEHLPMKESGDPLPLPQIVIDTSKNPGRNVFRKGYVEAVGSSMWLGDKFFALTGADKEKVMKVDWLEVEEIKPGIIKIKAQEECFTEFEGREAELQNKLRDLLYPNHEMDLEV